MAEAPARSASLVRHGFHCVWLQAVSRRVTACGDPASSLRALRAVAAQVCEWSHRLAGFGILEERIGRLTIGTCLSMLPRLLLSFSALFPSPLLFSPPPDLFPACLSLRCYTYFLSLVLVILYRASAQRSRLIPLCVYAMMHVDYTSFHYVIADARASKINISVSQLP